jgi:hypothetical protein
MKNSNDITIGTLYPSLSPEQLKEADENITAYLGLVLRVYVRLERDEAVLADFRALTASKTFPRFRTKVESN